MAYTILAKPNTDGATSDYPYGKIRDEVSPGDGTPVNTMVYGDQHQFFARLLALSGLSANNLPDNQTNGFQLYDALLKVVQPDWTSAGISFATVSTLTWSNLAGFYGVAYKVAVNEVSLCGAATLTSSSIPGSIPVLTLPTAARPASMVRVLAQVLRGSTATVEQITINTSGLITVNMGAGTFAPVSVWFDGITYRKA